MAYPYPYPRSFAVPPAPAAARPGAPAPTVSTAAAPPEINVKSTLATLDLPRQELEELLVALAKDREDARRFISGYIDIMALKAMDSE